MKLNCTLQWQRVSSQQIAYKHLAKSSTLHYQKLFICSVPEILPCNISGTQQKGPSPCATNKTHGTIQPHGKQPTLPGTPKETHGKAEFAVCCACSTWQRDAHVPLRRCSDCHQTERRRQNLSCATLEAHGKELCSPCAPKEGHGNGTVMCPSDPVQRPFDLGMAVKVCHVPPPSTQQREAFAVCPCQAHDKQRPSSCAPVRHMTNIQRKIHLLAIQLFSPPHKFCQIFHVPI